MEMLVRFRQGDLELGEKERERVRKGGSDVGVKESRLQCIFIVFVSGNVIGFFVATRERNCN